MIKKADRIYSELMKEEWFRALSMDEQGQEACNRLHVENENKRG